MYLYDSYRIQPQLGLGQYPAAVFEAGVNELPGGYRYTVGGTTLDMKDPAVLREVKMLTAASDFDVPYWTDVTQAAFNEYATAVEQIEPGMSAWMAAPAIDPKGIPHMVPTAVGVRVLLEFTAENQAMSLDDATKYYPNVVAWAKQNMADETGLNFTGLVNPPAFSESAIKPSETKKDRTGLIIGAIVGGVGGALVAGPVGAAVGAAGGAVVGNMVA